MTIHETPVAEPPKRLPPLRQQVEDLTAEVAKLKRQRDIVGVMLRDEAYEREWCSDYNWFVSQVNGTCGEPWLLPIDDCEDE